MFRPREGIVVGGLDIAVRPQRFAAPKLCRENTNEPSQRVLNFDPTMDHRDLHCQCLVDTKRCAHATTGKEKPAGLRRRVVLDRVVTPPVKLVRPAATREESAKASPFYPKYWSR